MRWSGQGTAWEPEVTTDGANMMGSEMVTSFL